jgi:hypothetical protein
LLTYCTIIGSAVSKTQICFHAQSCTSTSSSNTFSKNIKSHGRGDRDPSYF